ncbi:hypothetical protein [Halomonas sp. CKK8]|uniref:hypothetical protein n=1 Tax=Halomonas sp. CKK8 TaxID=3036127 RepID=UPI0024152D06|nr:hypothetical protein [Halomonas sp. CKK8]WFM72908.1 hypothetical protein P8934_07920 [Halomonas sp. CKK8]
MTQPTYTHKTQGGRFALVAHYNGDTTLDAQMIVVYRDINREIETATTAKDWEQNWQTITPDTCTVCMGTGHDHIKGAKHQPCGGCYGLGKVKQDGEKPVGEWELAEVALGLIKRQQQELEQRRQAMAVPEVRAALEAHKVARQRLQEKDWVAREQGWREGRGKGPGGARITGD